jgi:uncharacterized protein YlaI
MKTVDMRSRCIPCDRSFDSERSLEQHLQDSPAHARCFNCDDCVQAFDSEEALRQHLRNSPAHAFDCDDCDLAFDSEEALQQHLRDSPAHSFDCKTCDRSFSNKEALEQHLRASRIHQQDTESPTETPLDVFFRSFPTFNYDPSLSPATSYGNLQRQEGWRRNRAASDDAWNRYQDALQRELHLWYGAENDLTAWHALCRAIGIDPLPKTCEQCEEVGDRVTKFDRFMLTRVIGCTKDTR